MTIFPCFTSDWCGLLAHNLADDFDESKTGCVSKRLWLRCPFGGKHPENGEIIAEMLAKELQGK